jgi:hypothetical protein
LDDEDVLQVDKLASEGKLESSDAFRRSSSSKTFAIAFGKFKHACIEFFRTARSMDFEFTSSIDATLTRSPADMGAFLERCAFNPLLLPRERVLLYIPAFKTLLSDVEVETLSASISTLSMPFHTRCSSVMQPSSHDVYESVADVSILVGCRSTWRGASTSKGVLRLIKFSSGAIDPGWDDTVSIIDFFGFCLGVVVDAGGFMGLRGITGRSDGAAFCLLPFSSGDTIGMRGVSTSKEVDGFINFICVAKFAVAVIICWPGEALLFDDLIDSDGDEFAISFAVATDWVEKSLSCSFFSHERSSETWLGELRRHGVVGSSVCVRF